MHPFTAHSGLQNVKKEQFTIMSLISLLKTIFVNAKILNLSYKVSIFPFMMIIL